MTEMTVSETLNRAADLIEKRGWKKGYTGWPESAVGELCLEGGIMAAVGGVADDMAEVLWKCPAYHAVADYVGTHDPMPSTAAMGSRDLWQWNDAGGRTATEVIGVLRTCAVIEASRERQPAGVSS